MKTAILFLCHLTHDECLERYRKLVEDIDRQYDVFWAYQADGKTDRQLLQAQGIRLFPFTVYDLNALDYSPIAETLVPGSPHFVMELFFHQHPEYDYYWSVEYDVEFTGHWHIFFDAFKNNDSDMLSSHIEGHCADNEQWPWWTSLSFSPEDAISFGEYVKSFNPIYRLSHRALSFLDDFLKHEGNQGHFEALLPTILKHHGFTLQDIGGTGFLTPTEFRNRFYVQGAGINNGTIRWRPIFLQKEIEALGVKDKLFHPVKV